QPSLRRPRYQAINETNAHKVPLNEHALVDKVRPLIQKAIAILNQTLSQVNAADFGGMVAVARSHPTTPEEVTLAHSLSRVSDRIGNIFLWGGNYVGGEQLSG